MAESYFDLLTKRQELPAKPFDPLEELKLLRRRLAVRIQTVEPPMEAFEAKEIAPPPLNEAFPCEKEPVSIEIIAEKVGDMEETLTLFNSHPPEEKHVAPQNGEGIIHTAERVENKRGVLLGVDQYLNIPQERLLVAFNVGLMALGVIGVVFGILSFSRGWEGDLPLGSWVSASGMAIIALGLGGRFLASHSDQKLTPPPDFSRAIVHSRNQKNLRVSNAE